MACPHCFLFLFLALQDLHCHDLNKSPVIKREKPWIPVIPHATLQNYRLVYTHTCHGYGFGRCRCSVQKANLWYTHGKAYLYNTMGKVIPTVVTNILVYFTVQHSLLLPTALAASQAAQWLTHYSTSSTTSRMPGVERSLSPSSFLT